MGRTLVAVGDSAGGTAGTAEGTAPVHYTAVVLDDIAAVLVESHLCQALCCGQEVCYKGVYHPFYRLCHPGLLLFGQVHDVGCHLVWHDAEFSPCLAVNDALVSAQMQPT